MSGKFSLHDSTVSLGVKSADSLGSGLQSKAEEADDPWELPELKDNEVPWGELTGWGKVGRVTWIIVRVILLIGLLYMFICSLDFLSSAFRLLGGKSAGEAFAQEELLVNPVAGLMIGVLGTVLLQSSSTTTSIVVSMVASGIIPVQSAIPMIMGANIGTSVTNTIVSLGQISDRSEFMRAFAGATVHDMFNWLTVLILFPIECVSHMLYHLTYVIVNSMELVQNKDSNPALLKALTSPFTKLIVEVDKGVITKIAKNEVPANTPVIKLKCKTGNKLTVKSAVSAFTGCPPANGTLAGVSSWPANATDPMSACQDRTVDGDTYCTVTNSTCTWTYIYEKKDEKVDCNYLMFPLTKIWSDAAIGALVLVIALAILIFCLVCIVKLLHSLLRGKIAKIVKKTVNANFPGKLACLTGYLAIIVGVIVTILVQSSSIFTSAITPLVGIGVIHIDRMYPLTLGANIGTTVTAILASFTQSNGFELAFQVAMCHLFFNLIGIMIWYPFPFMRKVPIGLAKTLGEKTAGHRWFAVLYLVIMFFGFPAMVFALSIPGWQYLLGIGGPLLLFFIIIIVINVIQVKRPGCLPAKLRNWDFLPIWCHSLSPYDRWCNCCSCCTKEVPADERDRGKAVEVMVVGEDNIGYNSYGDYPNGSLGQNMESTNM
ncbi:sodium-dependent phosphate transport protein 2B [Lingula anatina]|uniref:Sodium-dependent phosphate transport protein 2B n=1 Tax=Lingula anatina TaxID=7574 RepID=A0A1S3ILW9_LINAN|nr:sodium-dependent phosphate transport protein 2B [Lingula anatina]|eukprot:XP_013398891.1 sodium-dependent phosphate transport protein 2B [Lingula anatina]